MVRNHEVTGSIPVCSTRYVTVVGFGRRPFSFIMHENDQELKRCQTSAQFRAVSERLAFPVRVHA